MEVHPDFDAREVARTVALAVSNLHNRTLSSDSCNDETPLVTDRLDAMNAPINASRTGEKDDLFETKKNWLSTFQRFPARYVLTFLGFLGFCNVYALRVNLSVALVSMVKASDDRNITYDCPVELNYNASNSTPTTGEFEWSPKVQANILGSFFYGYVITQVPGGRMAEIFGGKWLFGIGVLCTAVFTLLTPLAARWGVTALIVLRVLEGLGEGVTFPAMHTMLGRWVPKCERSMLSTIIYSGAQIGTVISMPISGLLCGSDFLGGWPSVFYVFGFLGCLWFVFWMLLVHETPEQHPRISRTELLLIQSETQNEDRKKQQPPVPWIDILTSVPVWALVITHFGQNWGFYTLLTELPTYLSRILHFDIKMNGFLSCLPYLLQAICSWNISYLADFIRRKNIFTISTIRKICNSVGFFGSAVCFLGVTLSGCNSTWAVTFLTLAMGFNGATYSGYMVTHVDMSPVFAGTLMGMTNCVANLAGILAPLAVGALTDNNETLHQWQIIFHIAMAVYIATGFLFMFCASARLQPWDASQTGLLKPNRCDDKEKDSDLDKN